MNPYSSYKRQTVSTMMPIEVVIKLFEECEKQLNCACIYIDKGDITKTNAALVKAWEVVNGLRTMLDMSIPISKELDKLYGFFCREILRANMAKDKEIINPIIPMVHEMRDTFVQVSKMPKGRVGERVTAAGIAV